MKKYNGFTIIELIVVIAIIGVLASIVLINVNSIRNKARDATLKEDMRSIFKLALDFYQETGHYSNFCEQDQEVKDLFEIIPAYEDKKSISCWSNSEDWSVCAVLNFPEDRSTAWCIDNSGNAKQIDAEDCKGNMHACP